MFVRILVVGKGGREHAICLAISKSKRLTKLYCAPGNAGTAELAENVPISATDIPGLLSFAKNNHIDLTVVGMDDTLALGIADVFKSEGLKIFAPDKAAAIIEYSKSFAKDFMKRNGIPTADYEVFSDYGTALTYVSKYKPPFVIKADGLAEGKGVVICHSKEEAILALEQSMRNGVFGKSGETVIIEEFMEGEEISVLCFCDGKTIKTMPEAQDHKRLMDKDMGPNTGGMGTYSPCSFYNEAVKKRCEEEIIYPTMEALIREGRPFTGCLFFGLMLTEKGPKVIEYNARFGDPETQSVLLRLDSDIVDILDACCEGNLANTEIKWKNNTVVSVIAASGGYPAAYKKGLTITGIEEAKALGAEIFFAGASNDDDKLVTNGGRVLAVSAQSDTFEKAKELAYLAMNKISFDGIFYRKDIGKAETKK